MDVTPRQILPSGMTHLWRSRTLPAGLLAPAAGGGAGAAQPPPMAAAVGVPAEVRGVADGADLVLPSGVHLRRTRYGASRVTDDQVAQAVRGIQLLPVQDQLAIARSGVVIELVPVEHLEQVPGTTEPVLGATAVNQAAGGRWVPRGIRVAVDSPLSTRGGVNSIGEVVQHEIGHCIAVMGTQDRSEATAIRYAQTY